MVTNSRSTTRRRTATKAAAKRETEAQVENAAKEPLEPVEAPEQAAAVEVPTDDVSAPETARERPEGAPAGRLLWPDDPFLVEGELNAQGILIPAEDVYRVVKHKRATRLMYVQLASVGVPLANRAVQRRIGVTGAVPHSR